MGHVIRIQAVRRRRRKNTQHTALLSARLTFELEGELIGVVEGEHLLVGSLIIGIEDKLSGEHKDRKASFHQFGLSMLLLLHWLQLSSSPSTVCLGPPAPRSLHAAARCANCLYWETLLPVLIASGTWHGAADARDIGCLDKSHMSVTQRDVYLYFMPNSNFFFFFFSYSATCSVPNQKMRQCAMWFTLTSHYKRHWVE